MQKLHFYGEALNLRGAMAPWLVFLPPMCMCVFMGGYVCACVCNYIIFVKLFLGVKFHVMVHTLKNYENSGLPHTTVPLIGTVVCVQ